MFTQLEENTVIISSGAEKSSGTGIAMVYRYGQVHCVVSTSTDTWFAAIQREKLTMLNGMYNLPGTGGVISPSPTMLNVMYNLPGTGGVMLSIQQCQIITDDMK
jgi:hypothetical protein